MSDATHAARLWTNGLSAPETEIDALAAVLADDVVAASQLGDTQGKTAVLQNFGRSPLAAFFAQGKWSEPVVDGTSCTMTCSFPGGSPVAGVTVRVDVDERGLIRRVESTVMQAPAAPPKPLELTPAIKDAINGALINATPVTVAYVDHEGQPHLSLRGTVQVFSPTELALWIRNPEGGLLAAIQENPRLALWYRDSRTRTSYQFHGRARRDDDADVRDRVFTGSPEQEQRMDAQRRGAAVIVELDRVEGRDASGPVVMIREG